MWVLPTLSSALVPIATSSGHIPHWLPICEHSQLHPSKHSCQGLLRCKTVVECFYLCVFRVPPNFVILLQSIINNFQCLLFSKGYTEDRSATNWKQELRLSTKCQHDESFTDWPYECFWSSQWDLSLSLTDRVCCQMFNDIFIRIVNAVAFYIIVVLQTARWVYGL